MNRKWFIPALIILTIIILIIALNFKREHIPTEVENSLSKLSDSVNAADEKTFLSLIDEKNTGFYAEERHLFEDIEINRLKGFRMVGRAARQLDASLYLVQIQQSCIQDGNKKSIKYDAVFRREGGQYKFSDLYFETIEKSHFIIKYQPSLKREAEKLAAFVDEVHSYVKDIYGLAPEDKTVIKLYDSNDVFNAFIKPSIKFRMAGWYEYPESIKMNFSSKLASLLPEASFKEHYMTVLSHELTHRINSMESNNNIPYWLAEGIATYVENKGRPKLEKESRHIAVLEKINLEALTGTGEIDAYYNDSYINTSLLINKYGLAGLHEMLRQLGTYPLERSTQGVVYLESNSRFHEVVKKLYGLDVEQLDAEIRK